MSSISSWLLVRWAPLCWSCASFLKINMKQLLFKTWSKPHILLNYISLAPPCLQAEMIGSICISCSIRCFFMVSTHFYAELRFFLIIGVLYIFLKLLFCWLYTTYWVPESKFSLTYQAQCWLRTSVPSVFLAEIVFHQTRAWLTPLHACMLGRFSGVRLWATLWTVACQVPLSMGFSKARILEWVATMPSSRGSYQPRDQTCGVSSIFCIAGGFFSSESLGNPWLIPSVSY